MTPPDDVARAVEAVLFAATEPLKTEAIGTQLGGAEVCGALAALETNYAGRGIVLVRRGERWHLQTAADMAHLLRRTRGAAQAEPRRHRDARDHRLSRARHAR